MNTDSRLQRIVDVLAPVNGPDFALKFGYWTVFDNFFALAIAYVLHGAGHLASPDWVAETVLLTTLVSVPITCLILSLLGYLRQQQVLLRRLALSDELTGLPNRRAYFLEANKLRLVLRAAHVFVADADHFKQINDRHGHEVGDLCLVAIADHLRGLDAPGLVISRMGGEEFALLLPETSAVTPADLGRRLSRPITVPLGPGGESLTLTLSAGAAHLTREQNIDRALVRADAALYRAKAEGRGRTIIDDDRGDAALAEPSAGTPLRHRARPAEV